MLALKMQIKKFHIGRKKRHGTKNETLLFSCVGKMKSGKPTKPVTSAEGEFVIFVNICSNFDERKIIIFKKKECWWKSSFMYDNILTLKHTCIRSLERASDQWTKSTNRRTQKTHIKCAFLITHPYKRSSLEFCMNCLVCSAIVCVYDAQIAWHTHSIWWEISIEVLPFQLLNGKFLIWYADIYKKCPLYIKYQRIDPLDYGNRIWNMSRNSVLIPFIRQNELNRLGKSIILRV